MAENIDLGIVGIKNMGEYNSQTNYEKLNVVTYQGSTYCALKNTTGNLPTNTEYWQLYAEKGGTGPQGPKPVKGEDYFTEEDITDIENDLKPTITSDVSDEVTSQLGSLVSATPLVASSVSEMIDTTRIYVNTTNGHWYWYDGTDWQDGGVYQATEDSDTVERLEYDVEKIKETIFIDEEKSPTWRLSALTSDGKRVESTTHIISSYVEIEDDLFLVCDSNIVSFRVAYYSSTSQNDFIEYSGDFETVRELALEGGAYARIECKFLDARTLNDASELSQYFSVNKITNRVSLLETETENIEERNENYIDAYLVDEENNTWVMGALTDESGVKVDSNKRCVTSVRHLEDCIGIITCDDPDIIYRIGYYSGSSQSTFIEFDGQPQYREILELPSNNYIRIEARFSDGRTISDVSAISNHCKFYFRKSKAAKKIDDIIGDPTSVIKLNNEIEMVNKLNQARNLDDGRHMSIKVEKPKVSLLAFSDLHGSGNQLKRVKEFADYYAEYINDVIHLGDTVASVFGPISFFGSMGSPNWLNTIGNHETNKLNQDSTITKGYYGESDCFDEYFADYINNWDVNYTNGKCYYYKDYDDSDLRLIVIDALHHSTEQNNWLSNLLSDALTNNLHVIIASHYAPGVLNTRLLKNPSLGNSLYNLCTFARSEILDMPQNNGVGDIVDTFINNGGKFICWLCGHNHIYDCGYVSNYPNQFIFVVSTQNVGLNPASVARVTGTKSQDMFCHVTIDTDNSMLKIVSVGADRDRLGRKFETMVFDYANKVLVSNN